MGTSYAQLARNGNPLQSLALMLQSRMIARSRRQPAAGSTDHLLPPLEMHTHQDGNQLSSRMVRQLRSQRTTEPGQLRAPWTRQKFQRSLQRAGAAGWEVPP